MDHARNRSADAAAADGEHAPANVQMMEDICHDVNSALATLVLCVDYIASKADCSDDPAVADARKGVRVVVGEMNKLRELARAVRLAGSGSGVFRAEVTSGGGKSSR